IDCSKVNLTAECSS
uniref:RK1 peptide n=1 Tax=Buthus occitanus tunetanus TaxID=6871 RepID=DIRK1_BUTOC|nr:RecName: Full=RK1 peptide; AltName: Full=Disintegrin-like peptide [Buthus occitanus tunetanus]